MQYGIFTKAFVNIIFISNHCFRDSNTATDLSGLNNIAKNGLHNSTSHPEKLTSQTNMHLNDK